MAILMRLLSLALLFFLVPAMAQAERVKDITDVEGVRDNNLIGYGLVVGLNGTGDNSTNARFSVFSILSMLERLGVSLRGNKDLNLSSTKPKNIAAVMVTAKLPSFSRPGKKLDITVSSLGDAKSLRGGTLLITPLLAGNGNVYAIAQGPVLIGGFTASGKGASTVKNHPTAGRIPNGATVERRAPTGLTDGQKKIILTLRDPDFSTAVNIQDAINEHMGGRQMAHALDGGTIEIHNPDGHAMELIVQLGKIQVTPDHRAVVVMDERTGTIVMGQEVRIDTVAVAHGNLSVTVTESPQVSQPEPFSGGKTTTVDRTDLQVEEGKAKLVMLPRQVSLSKLVSALNAVGATPGDLIAVLQAIKAAGALHAELRVL